MILHLPNELLGQIFLYVRRAAIPNLAFDDFIEIDDDDYLSEPNVEQVKQLRLTCRRFCANSSHLLKRHVKVEMTPKSLARLDEISRHPTISKGIRCIEICIGRHFDAEIAYDFRAFARFQGDNMRREIANWERDTRNRIFPVENPAELVQSIHRAIILAESFEEAAQNELNDNCPEHVLLREAQDCYRQRYESQLLLQRGPFAQAIVSAMMRMPTAKWLSIEDDHIRGKTGTYPLGDFMDSKDLESLETLRSKLTAPSSSWEWAGHCGLMSPPIDVIPSILLSIAKAEISLNGLQINVPWADNVSSFATAQTNLLKLHASSQQLKAFKFSPDNLTTLPTKAISLVTDFLSTILHISSLQTIDLCFDFMYKEKSFPRPTVSMAPLLLSCTWPSLEKMRFNGPFYLEDLRKVVNHIYKDVELQWSGYLLDGTWAEVLDFLRECEQRAANVTRLGNSDSDSIAGAECKSMSRADLCYIFMEDTSRRRLWSESRAMSYIRGWTKQNPLTDWENGDLLTTGYEGMDNDETEYKGVVDVEMDTERVEDEEC